VDDFDVYVLVCAIILLPLLEEMVVQSSEKRGINSILNIRAVGTFLLWNVIIKTTQIQNKNMIIVFYIYSFQDLYHKIFLLKTQRNHHSLMRAKSFFLAVVSTVP
jgi:hypothetical protein